MTLSYLCCLHTWPYSAVRLPHQSYGLAEAIWVLAVGVSFRCVSIFTVSNHDLKGMVGPGALFGCATLLSGLLVDGPRPKEGEYVIRKLLCIKTLI